MLAFTFYNYEYVKNMIEEQKIVLKSYFDAMVQHHSCCVSVNII